MKFIETPLKGAYIIECEPKRDHRGHFARTFCVQEFQKLGLVYTYVQMSTCHNTANGQIRGMHYQAEPYAETKIVRCTKGAVKDVIIDLRPESSTYDQWFSVELTENNNKLLYIPKGFAHGYKTLQKNTELFYMMDEYYHPESAKEYQSREEFWV